MPPGYDLQRADGRVPGGRGFATVGSTAPASSRGRTRRRTTGPSATGDRPLRRPGCPGDERRHGAGASSTRRRQPCRCSPPRPRAPRCTSPITVTANSSDSSGVALKSLTISVVGGATLATAANANSATAQWAPGDGTLHAQTQSRSTAANNTSEATIPVTVDSTPPPAFQVFAPASVAGRADAVLVVRRGGPYTFTITRDGGSQSRQRHLAVDRSQQSRARVSTRYVVTATDAAGNTASALASTCSSRRRAPPSRASSRRARPRTRFRT